MGVKFKGIDISYWQGKRTKTQMKKAKADGVEFIINRIGYGVGCNLDSVYENNYSNAVANGIDVGAYWYSTAKTVAQAEKEARFCVRVLAGRKLQYPVFIDIEDEDTSGSCSKETLADIAKAFCKIVEAAGYTSGVYASLSWLKNRIGNLGNLNIWVAQYNETCSWTKDKVMWQYRSNGKVDGFSGNIDMNYCYTEVFKKKVAASTVAKKLYSGTLPKLPIRRYFKLGDKGTNVKRLQMFLNWAVNANLKVDGILGDKTRSAVTKYQHVYALVEDGLFGRKCLAKAKIIRR